MTQQAQDVYDLIHKAASERNVVFKTTGSVQKINLLDPSSNNRHHFTIGMAQTSYKYELVVTSKRPAEFIKKLIDTVQQTLKAQKTETLHWNRLSQMKRHEIVFPSIKEIDPRFFGAKVTIVPVDYNEVNHGLRGLVHAIYGGHTNLARIKLGEFPNENC